MGFWTAWRFLTIFPSIPIKDSDGKELGSSLPYFPIVGLILGIILLGLDQLLDLFLPQYLNSALLLVSLVVMTGAIHLDGFMDTCDGFAVKTTSEDRLQIMKDSRIGGFGATGAFCLLILKFAAIVSLPLELRAVGLLLMPVISRYSVSYAIIAFPSARKEGLGNFFKKTTNWPMLLLSSIIVVGIATGLLLWIGPILVSVILIATILISKGLSSRLGGLTGDTYGAIIETVEVITLIGVVIIDKSGGSSWLDLS